MTEGSSSLIDRRNPIRIVHVLPSLIRAGAETQTVDLLNGLDPDQFDKHLFTFETKLDQLERLDRDHVHFHHSPRSNRFDLKPVRALAQVIDEHAIDVVHCTLKISLLFGWMAIRLARRKPHLLATIHTTKNRSRRDDRIDRMIYQWVMRGCTAIIFVCHAQAKHWQTRYPFLNHRTQVVYNGVDTDWFDPTILAMERDNTRRAYNIDAHAFVIVAVAAFRPEKGHRILVRAFGKIAKELPQAHLFLVGDGPLREEIARAVDSSGLAQRITFTGSLPDVRPVLSASDLTVIPSTAETFSMAMLESLSMGVPVVATDVGGAREAVIHDSTGLVVPPGDATALAEAIISLATDRTRLEQMRINARDLVCRKFSRQQMITETARAIHLAVDGHTG